MTNDNILLNSALSYAKRGWHVFPCRESDGELFWDKKLNCERFSPAKSPYGKAGFKEATTDENKIRRWWRKYPNAAIGISCGHSELVVIDVDVKDGISGYNSFMKLNISHEHGLHAITPSSGMHIIFSGATDSHSYQSLKIDIRSVGTYIVAPPSKILVDGKWKSYCSIDDWERTPPPYPHDLIEKLEFLKDEGKERVHHPKRNYNETPQQMRKKIQKALSVLDQQYCDDRFLWVQVGLAIKSAGEEYFDLWDDWSKKSIKYHKEKNKYVWDTFVPKEISIASLFYFAKESIKHE